MRLPKICPALSLGKESLHMQVKDFQMMRLSWIIPVSSQMPSEERCRDRFDTYREEGAIKAEAESGVI